MMMISCDVSNLKLVIFIFDILTYKQFVTKSKE